MLQIDTLRCTILNSTYEPLSVKSSRKGLLMVFKGFATAVESHPNAAIRSAKDVWEIPSQVVLKKFIKVKSTHRTPAQLKNHYLFVRDKYICQYCYRHKTELRVTEKLTRDHVQPTALGGKDVWENVVTSCSTCNNKKGDKFLSELGWSLPKKPYVPTLFEIWSKADSKKIKRV